MRTPFSRLLATSGAATVLTAGLVWGATPAAAESLFPSQLLDRLVVSAEDPAPPYDPTAFGHWVDADGDGCDTRAEVLLAESTTPAATGAGCAVTAGSWTSWYDGAVRTDPAHVVVDHLVPLEEAWQSGATAWTPAQREAYANDLVLAGTLAAVSEEADQAKGARDYAEWTPPAASAGCRYAVEWVQVKYRWNLTVDRAERAALAAFLPSCGSAPVDVPARADVPAPSPAGGTTMVAGQELGSGESLVSPSGLYVITMQADGNLVAYAPFDRVLFSADTWGYPGSVLRMQPDGNLVVYAPNGRPIWHSDTWHDAGAHLVIQDDGNVVLYRSDGSPAWSTGWDRSGLRAGDDLLPGQRVTSPGGRYHVTLQRDGNTVVYESRTGRPLWSAGSYGATLLRMQPDGNLVAYRSDG